MTDIKKDKIRLAAYIAATFVITYVFECVVFYSDLGVKYFTPFAAAVMFFPAIVTLIVCGGLTPKRTGIGWRPNFKKNIGWIILTWLAPLIVTVLGAVLYFAVFPHEFRGDAAGYVAALEESLNGTGVEITDGKLNGVPIMTLVTVQAVSAVFLAPIINLIPALGEEIGWRGFLTPTLTRLCGRKAALLISGVIWGLWHAPLIVIVGYEYGEGYLGAPWTGVALFCVVTTAPGILFSFVYDKTDCILVPALGHAAFNAISGLPIYFIAPEDLRLTIGPAPNGLLSMIPLVLLALAVFFIGKEKLSHTQDEEPLTDGESTLTDGESPPIVGEEPAEQGQRKNE